MSVARPIQPSPETIQKRAPGGISRESGNWTVVEESRHVKDGYLHSCGTYLMGKGLRLTVRDGIFPLSGSGETRPETVPYCLKCEKEPTYGYITPGGVIVIN